MVKAMRDASPDILMDVHLCVDRPARYVTSLAKAGATSIIFQFEALKNANEALDLARTIKANGMEVGISINPSTPVKEIIPLLQGKLFDIIDILAVEPGFGGQKFQPSILSKVEDLALLKAQKGLAIKLMIDGGMNGDTSNSAISAGADILVAGTFLFRHEAGITDAKQLLLDISE